MGVEMIVCDLGGVVIDIDTARIVRAWAARSELDVAEFLRATPDEVARSFERGKVSEDEYLAHVRQRFRLSGTAAEITRDFNALYVGVNEQVVSLLRELDDRGIRLVALTNTNVTHHREWRGRFADVVELFDRIYLSFELGAAKPDPKAFHQVLEDQRVEPEDAVFIDDTVGHVRAARQIGLTGIEFTHADELRTRLQDLGLLS